MAWAYSVRWSQWLPRTGFPGLLFLAWAVGGLIAFCGALAYAEIGSRFPVTGAYYKIFSVAYHPSLAFAIILSLAFPLPWRRFFFCGSEKRERQTGLSHEGGYPFPPLFSIAAYLFVAIRIVVDDPSSAMYGGLSFAGFFVLYFAPRAVKKRGYRPIGWQST